jgi:hypothetical protein
VLPDGGVIAVISSAEPDRGAAVFAVGADGTPRCVLGDLTAACGDAPGLIAQGKCHTPLFADAARGLVYFSSHVGWYASDEGREVLPREGQLAPDGKTVLRGPYPGGCLLSLAPATGAFRVLARLPGGEGVITMAADVARRRLFCLAWPSGRFGCLEMGDGGGSTGGGAGTGTGAGAAPAPTLQMRDYEGRGDGEDVHPSTGSFRPVCRAIVVDPRTGVAYFTNAGGDVLQFDAARAAEGVTVCLPAADGGLRRDYLGSFGASSAGNMGLHWRQVHWCAEHPRFAAKGGCIVGTHGNSGYLFEMTVPVGADAVARPGRPAPRPRLELVERLTSLPSRRAGVADLFTYGYLSFALRGSRCYLLTGAPIFSAADGRRLAGKAASNKGEAKGLEHLHLVTYDLAEHEDGGRLRDHGPVFYRDATNHPTYVNSLAISGEWLYSSGRRGDGTTELFRVRDPTLA